MALSLSHLSLIQRVERLENLGVQTHHVLAELQNTIARDRIADRTARSGLFDPITKLEARMKALEDHHD